MHEYSLVSALLDSVEAEARARNAGDVYRIRVRIGKLSGVEAGLFESAFELARAGTRCAGSELEVVAVEAIWECPSCGRGVEAGRVLRCPECGAPARLVSGDEIVLEQIEMELE